MKKVLSLFLIIFILILPSGCSAAFHQPISSQISIEMTRKNVEELLGEPYFTHTDGAYDTWHMACYSSGDQHIFVLYTTYHQDHQEDQIRAFWVYDSQRRLLAETNNDYWHRPNILGDQLTVDASILSESFYPRHLLELAEKYYYCSKNYAGLGVYSYYNFFPTNNGCCLVIGSALEFEKDSMEYYDARQTTGHPLGEAIIWIAHAEVIDYFTGESTVLLDVPDYSVFEDCQRDYLRQKGIEE